MCQLTYANLHNSSLNSLMIYVLGRMGAGEKHDDGCGFICPDNSIWKSQFAANNIINLGEIISQQIVDDKPIPFHVRWASYGIEVSKENSHPFDGKHFILMHNGTLLPRNGEEPKDKKKDSDSLRFLNALDEQRDANKGGKFEDIFNKAMEQFAGKFAFIIREKETNIDYIIRGRTAELWISRLSFDKQSSGYIVNTSKETMKKAFLDAGNIWSLFFSEEIEFTEPVLLKQETIFIATNDTIEEIGTTKEATPVKAEILTTKPQYPLTPRTRNNEWNNYSDSNNNKDVNKIISKAVKIYNYLNAHCMGLIDLQLMFMVSSGISLLEVTEEDLDAFIDYTIPKISASNKVKKEISRLLNGAIFPPDIYQQFNLEYPWPVNDGQTVINSLKKYMKEI